MRLQSKIFIITALIFFLLFVIDTYRGQQQIKEDVIANIKGNAATLKSVLVAYRSVYQKIFLEQNVPINDKTIQFLPAHAISRISHEFVQSVTTGLSFSTVSDRPRNPINQADQIELSAIDFFRKNDTEKELFVPFRNSSGEDFYHYSQPLRIKPRCLKCHGAKDKAPQSVQKRYNTAYDYKIGEIRGLLSIKLPAAVIKQRTHELLQHNIISHFLGMLLSFILIALLFNRTIISRIKTLQRGSASLAQGNYKTQIKLSGNDELTQMGHEFNNMAKMIALREQQLIKQQSLYYALSQTNKSIAQLDSTDKLLNKICQIASNQNNIIFTWFGMADSEQKKLIPVAQAGQSNGYLDDINLSLQSNRDDDICPTNSAFILQEIFINNHFLNDPDTQFFHKNAQQAGIQSVASFPISIKNQVVGVFSVYSDMENYFTEEIVNLLQEMTNDVEYAIRHYDLQQQHTDSKKQLEQSAKELSELNDLMTMLLESTGEGIFGVDKKGRCTFINPAAQSLFGYTEQELKNKSIHQLTHHSYDDGSVYPEEKCPIYTAFYSGQACQIDNEVFWHKNGSSFPVHYSAYPVRNARQEITGSVVIFRDITESRAMTQELNYMASHDSLTLLLNRYSFEKCLRQAIESTQFKGTQHVVCYIDLDQFKIVNDTCGHLAGDDMLKLIAHLLKKNIHKNDTLARLGGDEFGLLLENHSIAEALEVTEHICQSIKDFRFIWEDKVFNTGCSIGIATINEDCSVQNIMSTVDAACYIAKDKGRNQVYVSSSDDTIMARHQGEMQWVFEIRKALEENRFVLFQQCIEATDVLAQNDRHFEILLRMRNSKGELVPPGSFLPAAERYNLMVDLDRWVIQSTFKWLSSSANKQQSVDFCSINLSGQSISDDNLYSFIMEQQKAYNIDPQIICFEVTESAAITHLEQAVIFIKRLREHGFLFALDDFGTGMSSFAYLKNLPVNFLKIDGSFIKDIIDDPIDHAMVKSINDIGHIMGLKTIAEYVESEEIKKELIHLKIDYLQGYEISPPVPCDT